MRPAPETTTRPAPLDEVAAPGAEPALQPLVFFAPATVKAPKGTAAAEAQPVVFISSDPTPKTSTAAAAPHAVTKIAPSWEPVIAPSAAAVETVTEVEPEFDVVVKEKPFTPVPGEDGPTTPRGKNRRRPRGSDDGPQDEAAAKRRDRRAALRQPGDRRGGRSRSWTPESWRSHVIRGVLPATAAISRGTGRSRRTHRAAFRRNVGSAARNFTRTCVTGGRPTPGNPQPRRPVRAQRCFSGAACVIGQVDLEKRRYGPTPWRRAQAPKRAVTAGKTEASVVRIVGRTSVPPLIRS